MKTKPSEKDIPYRSIKLEGEGNPDKFLRQTSISFFLLSTTWYANFNFQTKESQSSGKVDH